MESLQVNIGGCSRSAIKEIFRKPKYPRKLKKAIKKAWRFEENKYFINVVFEPVIIKNNKLQHKVKSMIKFDNRSVQLPLWNGQYMCANRYNYD